MFTCRIDRSSVLYCEQNLNIMGTNIIFEVTFKSSLSTYFISIKGRTNTLAALHCEMWDLRRPDLTRTRRLAAKHGHLGANNNIGIRCESFRFFTIFPKWKAGLMEQSQAARRPRLVIPSIGERKYYTELISIVSCCLPSFLHFTLVVIPRTQVKQEPLNVNNI